METKHVNVKEILQDIHSGMNDAALMQKYQLSENGLQYVFKHLVDSGRLEERELEERTAEPEQAPEYVWKCSQCGAVQPESFDQCPSCHAIGSRIKAPQSSEQAEEINGQETQGDRHTSGMRALQDFLGTVLGSLSERHFYIIGSIGALILLFIVIVSFRALYPIQVLPSDVKQKLYPVQVLPTDVEEKLLARYKDHIKSGVRKEILRSGQYAEPEISEKMIDELVDPLFNLKVIKAEKGIATQVIRDQINPKEIYCVRFSLSGAGIMRRPSAFNVMLYQLQSGELEATSLEIEEYDQGYNSCPKDWDNICPFGCRDSFQAVVDLRKKLDKLVKASSDGDLNSASQLVSDRIDINGINSEGETPLIAASEKGHLDVVRLLLDKGADINAKDRYGQTALMMATHNYHLPVVKELLDKGVDVSAKDRYGQTALMMASIKGHREVVRLILDKGVDVSAKDHRGWTALMAASAYGHLSVVKELQDKGVDINAKGQSGWTALVLASMRGHLDVATLLLDKGADINAKDQSGWTALYHATEEGKTDVVDLLEANGAR